MLSRHPRIRLCVKAQVTFFPDSPPIHTSHHVVTTSGTGGIASVARLCRTLDIPRLCRMYSMYVHTCRTSDLSVSVASDNVDNGCAVCHLRELVFRLVELPDSAQENLAGATVRHREEEKRRPML